MPRPRPSDARVTATMEATRTITTSDEDEGGFFSVRILGPALVISFRRPCQVVSWAPLHGGFRTHVSHIVNCRTGSRCAPETEQAILRRTASKAGIKGTFVGMLTSTDIREFRLAQSEHGGLHVSALSTTPMAYLATDGESRPPDRVPSLSSGGLNLILVVNQRLTHEAMLKSISTATEAKVKALYDSELISRPNRPQATGTAFDCIAVASGGIGHHRSASKHTKLGELIGKACLESLRAGLRSADSRKSD